MYNFNPHSLSVLRAESLDLSAALKRSTLLKSVRGALEEASVGRLMRGEGALGFEASDAIKNGATT